MEQWDENYLLDHQVKIFQPNDAYHASTDAVWLAAALNNIKPESSILDAGTGTGAIALCLAHRLANFNPQITAIDIQQKLLIAAQASAQANNFNNIRFLQDNLLKSNLPPCSFAHIITNPPYAFADQPSPNFSKATAHNLHNIKLTDWINACIRLLRPQGHFYIINRTAALEEILAAIHGKLGHIEIFPLYSKPEQPCKRVIIRAQKDSKSPLILHPSIFVHNQDNSHTTQAIDILRHGTAL